jgi:hypothetical protein
MADNLTASSIKNAFRKTQRRKEQQEQEEQGLPVVDRIVTGAPGEPSVAVIVDSQGQERYLPAQGLQKGQTLDTLSIDALDIPEDRPERKAPLVLSGTQDSPEALLTRGYGPVVEGGQRRWAEDGQRRVTAPPTTQRAITRMGAAQKAVEAEEAAEAPPPAPAEARVEVFAQDRPTTWGGAGGYNYTYMPKDNSIIVEDSEGRTVRIEADPSQKAAGAIIDEYKKQSASESGPRPQHTREAKDADFEPIVERPEDAQVSLLDERDTQAYLDRAVEEEDREDTMRAVEKETPARTQETIERLGARRTDPTMLRLDREAAARRAARAERADEYRQELERRRESGENWSERQARYRREQLEKDEQKRLGETPLPLFSENLKVAKKQYYGGQPEAANASARALGAIVEYDENVPFEDAAEAMVLLGATEMLQGNPDKAEEAWRWVLAKDPEYPELSPYSHTPETIQGFESLRSSLETPLQEPGPIGTTAFNMLKRASKNQVG